MKWIHQSAMVSNDVEVIEPRINGINLMAAFCRRQETRRESKKQAVNSFDDSESDDSDSSQSFDGPAKEDFPMVCKPRQCIWCLGDTRKTFKARVFEYSRVNKMLDEADRHLEKYTPDDKVPCPHPVCREIQRILSNKMHFMNHVARDHGIFLRAY